MGTINSFNIARFFFLSIFFSGIFSPDRAISQGEKIIVKWKDTSPLPNTDKTYLGILESRYLPSISLEILQIPEEWELPDRWLCGKDDFIQELVKVKKMVYAEPDYQVISQEKIPDDTAFLDQWYLLNLEQNGCPMGLDIRAGSVWEKSTGSDSVLLGIIDSGIDWRHPDLADNIWQNLAEDADGDGEVLIWDGSQWKMDPGDLNGIDDDGNGYIDDLIGWDFVNDDNDPMDDNDHGTHVAGIVGAKGNNGTGISGINWDISILALKALNENGIGKLSDLLEAIDYSISQDIKITNNSWSMEGNYSQALYESIKMAGDSVGQLFIAAAGNTGNDNDLYPVYPSAFDLENILSVSASDCFDHVPVFANYGSKAVDIFAPGDGIYSTLPGGLYGYKNGSSMAAPMVAGAAALILSLSPDVGFDILKGKILGNARRVPAFLDKCRSGGVLDLDAAYSGTHLFSRGEDAWRKIRGRFRWTVVEEQGNYIWAGTYGGGLIRIDKQTQEQEFFDSSNSGLPINRIQDLEVHGSDLWIVTAENALSRFDGSNWTTYRSIPSSFADLAIKNNSEVWVLTRDSLYAFINSNWRNYSQLLDSISFSNFSFHDVFVDSSQNLWIANFNSLNKLNVSDSTWTTVPFSDSLISNQIHNLEIDSIGNFWISTSNGTLIYDPIRETLDTLRTGSWRLDITGASDMSFGKNGSVWLNSFYIYEVKSGLVKDSLSTSNSPLRSHANRFIHIDDENKLWVFSPSSNLQPEPYFQVAKDTLWSSEYQVNDYPAAGSVPYIVEDPQNGIWVSNGTSGGMSRYLNGEWIEYSKNTLAYGSSREPGSVSFDSLGNYWIILQGRNRLFQCREFQCAEILLDSLLPSQSGRVLNSILVRRNGDIILGSQYGLLYYDGTWSFYDSTQTPFTINGAYSYTHPQPLYEDHQGKIWINADNTPHSAANNLLYVWDKENDSWSNIPGLYQVDDVAESQDSTLWILGRFGGSTAGLIRLKDSIQSPTIGLPSNYRNIYVDKNNQGWIVNGTNGGLLRVIGDQIIQYNTENSSLGMDQTHSVLVDENNKLWLGTFDGLMVIDLERLVSFVPENDKICLGTQNVFNNLTSVADSFAWYIDEQYVSSDKDLQYTFTEVKNYQVTLKAYTDTISESFSRDFEVYPPPQIDLGADTTACAQSIYLFSTEPSWSYTWSNLQGDTLSRQSYYIAEQTDTYIVEAQDLCGVRDRDSIVVSLNNPPTGSCVWPGDVDGNGWVNALDFLILGSLHGETGPPRPNARPDFVEQSSTDWGRPITHLQANGIDMKHADCDGDGIIDLEKDGKLIFRHAQGAFPQQVQANASGLQLRVVPRQRVIQAGDSLVYDVFLSGPDEGDVENLYGLAFSQKINLSPFSNTQFLGDGWFGNQGQDLETGVIRYGRSTDYVMSGKDKKPRRGKGKLGTTHTKEVATDIDTSRFVSRIYLTSQLSNARIFDLNGGDFPISILQSTTLETVTVNLNWVSLNLKVYLQGAWDSLNHSMNTTLNQLGLLPNLHPYGKLFQAKPDSIPSDIVDWVWVELRAVHDPDVVIAKRVGWLSRDGSIKDAEGGTDFAMQAKGGNYYVAIGHRNHLPVVSKIPILINTTHSASYDFTQAGAAFGVQAQVQLGTNSYGLIVGDINQNGEISYRGVENDLVSLNRILGTDDLSRTIKIYSNGDLNMDGKVQVSGIGNDRKLILRNLGGDDPSKNVTVQIP